MRDRLRTRAQHLDWLSSRLVHPRVRIDTIRARANALTLRLRLSLQIALTRRQQRRDALMGRLRECAPLPQLHEHELRRQYLAIRLLAQGRRSIELAEARLGQALGTLNTLSPLATLARGYAIVEATDSGTIVRDAATLRPGDTVRARLARGQIDCRVEKIRDA
jgi:exodeoxyribonuclease VII large subunit